jgi:hypothetical protein
MQPAGSRVCAGFVYASAREMGATMADNEVTLKLSKPEALALLNAAETGLRVIEALNLVKNVGLTEEAVRKLRAAA